MKKFLTFLVAIICTTTTYAQERIYCHVTLANDGFGHGTFCLVDIGQAKALSIEFAALRDDSGEIMLFNSPIHCLNQIIGQGWSILGNVWEGKLSQAKENVSRILLGGTPTEYHHTLECIMYKDLINGETKESAYSLFSNFQKKAEQK